MLSSTRAEIFHVEGRLDDLFWGIRANAYVKNESFFVRISISNPLKYLFVEQIEPVLLHMAKKNMIYYYYYYHPIQSFGS